MWKEITISQKSYFIKCCFIEDDKKRLICTLYDRKDFPWIAEQEFCDVKRKVKLLNRRYDFNEENIRDTLTGGELELATLEKENEKTILKLKYRFKNCPFNFEWSMVKQTMQQFQEMFVNPMFSALLGCKEQIDILKDCLTKKDTEILQYRREGAILGRKTLATKIFDFADFDRKYEERNILLEDFNDLGKYVLEHSESKEKNLFSSPKKEKQNDTKTMEKPAPFSPGQRKRKQLKQQMMETALNTRATRFEYESSQSQVLSQEMEKVMPTGDNDAGPSKLRAKESSTNSPEKPIQPIQRDNISTYMGNGDNKNNSAKSTKETASNDEKKNLILSPSKPNNQPTKKSPEKGKDKSMPETTNKKGFKYESSSSQTASSSSSQLTEEYIHKGNLKKQSNNDQVIKNGLKSPKKKKDNKSDTESDASTILIIPRRRQSRQLSLSQEDENANDNKKEKPKSPSSSRGQLSMRKRKDSIEFSSDTEDEGVLAETSPIRRERRKCQTTPTSLGGSTTNSFRSSIQRNTKRSLNYADISDSSDNDVSDVSTPRKRKLLNMSLNRSPKKSPKAMQTNIKKAIAKSGTDTDDPIVVEISTDSEITENPSTPSTKLRRKVVASSLAQESLAFSIKSRITRSSPQILSAPKPVDNLQLVPSRTIEKSLKKNSDGLVIGEITSQLESIRKELESLEALRLADLKRRPCKA
ncbi:uncharacterized protein LOC142232048 isoform X2 [Haematobia irritans]|uniref:uncharacterized protein LOC142232048 isoform X2 n=1 Tax=Haematobia irritans TaxID=7368 RepID=UPI003F501F21